MKMNNEFNFLEARVEWDERHAALLKDFLDGLVFHGIRYVILKNDDGLPYENQVGTVILHESYNRVTKSMESAITKFTNLNACVVGMA